MPNRQDLESFGQIWIPAKVEGGPNTRLQAGEPVPPNAFLAVTNPKQARQVAFKATDRWLQTLIAADRTFPHDPERTAHFMEWYDLLFRTATDPSKRREYALEYLEWAEAGLERSPLQPWFHEWYAAGLWRRANFETGDTKDASLRKGLDEFTRATQLYPSSYVAFWQLGDALQKFSKYLDDTGRKTEADKRRQEAQEAFKESERLKALKKA